MTERKTIFSPDRVYRYTLWREWDIDLLTGCSDDLPNSSRYVNFIALNPSTADETKDDPTIRRCIGFAKRWGFGAMCMTNIFAFRATDPQVMKAHPAPTGPENDWWLKEIALSASIVIAAWGTHGTHLKRFADVRAMIPNLKCLGTTQDGHPKHPLYLSSDTQPIDL